MVVEKRYLPAGEGASLAVAYGIELCCVSRWDKGEAHFISEWASSIITGQGKWKFIDPS